MADKLNAASIGDNHKLTMDEYQGLVAQLDDAESDHMAAVAACKDPKKKIKDLRKSMREAGIDLKMFDRAREDRRLSASQRTDAHTAYLQMMAWERAPVGTQTSFLETPTGEMSVHELKRVDTDGYAAGKRGRAQDENPHEVGSEPYQRWSNAWMRAQKEMAEALGDGLANGNGAGATKRRGRPRKDAADTPPPPVNGSDGAGAAVLE